MRLALAIVFTTSLWAGHSLITTTTNGTLTLPTVSGSVRAPYNNITTNRVEFRLTNVKPCVSGSPWGNFFRMEGRNIADGSVNFLFGFGCGTTGGHVFNAYQGVSPQTLGTIDYPEMVVRLQRDGAGLGRYSVEVWKPDGTGYQNLSYNSAHAGVAVRLVAAQNMFLRGDGTADIAWLRWYSTTLPEGSAMPKDSGAPAGDLGNWEFEQSLADTSGNGINISRSGSCSPRPSCYAASPVHPPVAQFTASNAIAGSTVTLDGSQSFAYDGATITDYLWEQVTGPVKITFDSRHAASPRVSGVVTGEYTFRLTVTIDGGVTASSSGTVKVRNLDVNGFSVLPSNTLRGILSVSFRLEDVLNSAKVRVNVMKPDGRMLPSVTCHESPCTITVDDRQKDHLVQLIYLDAEGNMLSSSEWQRIQVTQVPRPLASTTSFLRPYIKIWGLTSALLGGATKRDEVGKFFADKALDFSGGEVSLRKWNKDAMQPTYSDHAGAYPYELYALYESAASHGYAAEDMFLHMSRDYQTTGGYIWSGMDRFDIAETNPSAGYANGVVLVNGTKLIDKTNAAYDNTAGDVPIPDKVMIGSSEPFDEVNFVLSFGAVGCPVLWEYWNGSGWSPLTLRSDTTVANSQLLAQSGKALFTPPADWAKSVQSGNRSKWWIRISVYGGTTPVASRIYGDNWMTDGNARGWDANHSGRVNVGLGQLEYNPTPPAGASARFRHQARLLGIWANSLPMFNLSNVQNGERTVARFVVDRVAHWLAAGWNGVWVDNGIPRPQVAGGEWQDRTEMAGKSFVDEAIESYKQIGSYMRSMYPDYVLCTNTSEWALARHGNCFYDELLKFTYLAPQPPGAFSLFPASDWRSAGPEQVKPQNNPNGVVAWIEVYDNLDTESLVGPTWLVWDKAVRGPMTALASYLMYANENTRFMYHNNPNYWYWGLDDFRYQDTEAEWTITSTVPADTSTNVKYATGDFNSFPRDEAGVMVRMGPAGEYVTWKRVSSTQISTTERIGNSYEAGIQLFRIRTGRMSWDDLPPLERIHSWGQYFPAMNIDIGIPDEAGHNGGRGDTQWKSAGDSGTINGIQRRDFTNAIVLFANASGVNAASGNNWVRLTEYGTEYIFEAEGLPAMLYPLRPDGTTGPGVSSIRLRTGEGAVLMKQPVY